MVERSAAPETLDRIFHALSDPTRRRILDMVTTREHSVGELARPFDMSLAAVSKHVKVLEGAGLVHRRRLGRAARLRLNPPALETASAWLEHYRAFWERRLDALERLVLEEEPERPRDKGRETR